MPISGKAIVKRLEREGWTIKSQSGSHVKLENARSEIVIVPVHGNKDLGVGLGEEAREEDRSQAHMIRYQALIEKDGVSYTVSFPDLPGCFSSGETRQQGVENAREL